jgi:hypothetical protein
MPDPLSSLESTAKVLSNILIYGGGIAVGAVLAQAFAGRRGEIEVFGFKIPVGHAWLAMLLLTIGHVFYSEWLTAELTAVLSCADRPFAQDAWETLTGNADDRRALYGMSERKPTQVFGVGNISSLASMPNDLLLWLHVILAMGIFIATLRWFSTKSWPVRIATTLLAAILLSINWWTGSRWALLASDLPRYSRNEPRLVSSTIKPLIASRTIRCPHTNQTSAAETSHEY